MKYSLIFIFSLMSLSLFAQKEKDKEKDLGGEKVVVEKEFDARLLETEKLKVAPSLPAVDTVSRRLSYDIASKTLKIDYQPPKLRPVAVKGDPLPKAYRGYLKAGYGIPSSPYGEASYTLAKAGQYNLDIHGRHHSANYANLENQRFSKTNLGVGGSYYLNPNNALTGRFNYGIDKVYFYGYDHEKFNFTKDKVEQKFNLADLSVTYGNSHQTGSDLNYFVGADVYGLTDNYDATESGTNLKAGATKWINKKFPLSLVLRADLTNFKINSVKQTLNNIYIQPSFTYSGDNFKVQLGANLVSYKSDFTIYPVIEGTVNIAGNQLAAFAGWKGDFYKNNFRNLTTYNPFLVSNPTIKNTRYQDFYGGVKGHVSFFDYHLQAGYKRTNDIALFLTDNIDPKRFQVLYDTANIFYLKGTISGQPMKNLEIIATLGNNVYSLKNQAKAWHLPFLEANIGAKYRLLDEKLRVRGELYIANGVPYKDLQNEEGRLNPLLDVNVGAEYSVMENIGVFLDINNLLNNKRERWLMYPTYGLNILGGITAKF